MAQEDFSLISVDADEEDDVVIQAGVVRDDAIENGEADPVGAPGSLNTDDAPNLGEGASDDDGLVDQAADEASRREYEQHRRRSEARRNATSMVTTEEDLHTKMPFANMQRIIMVVLVLLIVAAIVYWFFLR